MTRPTSKDAARGANRFSVLEVEPCSSDDDPNDIVVHSALFPGTLDASLFPPTSERYYIRTVHLARSLTLKIQLQTLDSHHTIGVVSLVDCGATSEFISDAFVREHRLPTRKLERPIPVYNVDGTLNEGGSIREEVELIMRVGDHAERVTFSVCSLGNMM